MLAFESMIAEAARKAGMKVPPDESLDQGSPPWDKEEYPHFAVFCALQLGVPMNPGEHWTNAEVIAKIPDDKIRTSTVQNILDLGFTTKG